MRNNNSIAILGGMGPQASAKLLEVMVAMCTNDFGIKNDSDFPEIILDSVPVPNFVSDTNNSKKALKILESRVAKLEAFNPVCFGISCNTAHILLPELQKSTKVPFVSIIKEVASGISKANLQTVGLLASPTTISSKLYQTELKKRNIKVIIPSENQINALEMIIRKVLAGNSGSIEIKKLNVFAKSLQKRGAGGIILGCTELPLIFPKNFDLPVFDSTEILARSLLRNIL